MNRITFGFWAKLKNKNILKINFVKMGHPKVMQKNSLTKNSEPLFYFVT